MDLRTINVIRLKRWGKYSIYGITALLLLVWASETPSGILGKADAVGYAFCHRIDLRSFHIGIRQLSFCARCTGQYLGAMLGLVFQLIFSRRRSGFPPKTVIAILSLLGLAYVVDGLNSYLYLPPFFQLFPSMPHLYLPSNTLRLFTGTGMGLVIALFIYPAFVGTVYSNPDPLPAMASIRSIIGLLITAVLADLLILNGAPYVLFITALISAVGVIILLSMVYTILILRLLKRENRSNRLLQLSLPLTAGLLITMSQIAILDLLRYVLTGTWGGFVF